MEFWEAIKNMQEGEKITNDEGDSYYFIQDNKLYLCTGKLMGEVNISVNDMLDSHWEIYEEKKNVDPKLKELYHYLKDENGFANSQYGEFIYDNDLEDYLLGFYMQLLEMAKYYNLD